VTLGTVVLVGLLGGLAVVGLVALVRVARTMGRTRDLARFQREATDLAASLAREGNPLVRDLDDLRRRMADVAVADARLATALPALRALAEHARGGLHAPPGLEPLAAAVAGEASRAVRSAELAKAGVEAMLDYRGTRAAEGSTSIKRAVLNLRNAIDEAARTAARIRALTPADLERPGAVAGAIATATLPTYGVSEDDLPIGTDDPTM
jgi:hypothetical protein